MLSIIIPTLNEEENIKRLLDSIKKQSFLDYEIILADGGSKDKTVDIAKKYGCKIIHGGGSPPEGRNKGAEVAKGNLILFVDADVYLSDENCLEKSLKEFKKRKLDIAGCLLQSLNENVAVRISYNLIYNIPILFLERVLPHAGGVYIIIKKSLHEKIGGFNEKIVVAEDHIYAREAAKFGKFRILRSVVIFDSPRRFEQDGWSRTAFKFLFAEFHITFFGPITSNSFLYHFSPYQESKRLKKRPRNLEIMLAFPLLWVWFSLVFILFFVGLFQTTKNKIKLKLMKK